MNFGQTNFLQKFRFGAYGKITPKVNILQICPGNSQSNFQFSLASKVEADDTEY